MKIKKQTNKNNNNEKNNNKKTKNDHIQEIFPRVCLSDLQISREIFPVCESQCELMMH